MSLSQPSSMLINPEHVIQGQRSCARSCAISSTPYASIAITSGDDWTASVWDANTGQRLFLLAGHARNVKEVAISGDGLIAATSGKDGSVRVWNTASGAQVWKLQLDGCSTAEGCSLTPDGFTLATIFSNKRLWKQGKDCWLVVADVKNKKLIHMWHFAPASMLQCIISQDASVVAVTLWTEELTSEVRVINLSNSCAVRRWDCNIGRKPGISLDACGNLVLIADGTNLRVCNVSENKNPRVLSSKYPYLNCSLSADGQLAVASDQNRHLHLWDIQSGSLRAVLGQNGLRTRSCAISPDGSKAIATSDDLKLRVWNLENLYRSQQLDEVQSSSDETRSSFSCLPHSSLPTILQSPMDRHNDPLYSTVHQDSASPNENQTSRHTSYMSLAPLRSSINAARRKFWAEDDVSKNLEQSKKTCVNDDQGSLTPPACGKLVTESSNAAEGAARSQDPMLNTPDPSLRVMSGREFFSGLQVSHLPNEASIGSGSLELDKESSATPVGNESGPLFSSGPQEARTSTADQSLHRLEKRELSAFQKRAFLSNQNATQISSGEGLDSKPSPGPFKLTSAVGSEGRAEKSQASDHQILNEDHRQSNETTQSGPGVSDSSAVMMNDPASPSAANQVHMQSDACSQLSKVKRANQDLTAQKLRKPCQTVRDQLEVNPSLSLDEFLSSIYMTPRPGSAAIENAVSTSSTSCAEMPERKDSAANGRTASCTIAPSVTLESSQDMRDLHAEPLSGRCFEFENFYQTRDTLRTEANLCESVNTLGRANQEPTTLESSFMKVAGSLEGRISAGQAARISIGISDQYKPHISRGTEEKEYRNAESLYEQHGCFGPGLLVDFQLFTIVTAHIVYS